MNGSVSVDYAPLAEYEAAPLKVGEKGSLLGYALLYLPFGAAWLVAGAPVLSYIIAWLGSFWILVLTLTGRVKPLPADRSLFDQVLRPIVLTQLIFAGYNFISSVFFFLDIHGFYYIWRDPFVTAPEELVALTAEAQRYYVLAHASVATGMLAVMDYRRSGKWVSSQWRIQSLSYLQSPGSPLCYRRYSGVHWVRLLGAFRNWASWPLFWLSLLQSRWGGLVYLSWQGPYTQSIWARRSCQGSRRTC